MKEGSDARLKQAIRGMLRKKDKGELIDSLLFLACLSGISFKSIYRELKKQEKAS